MKCKQFEDQIALYYLGELAQGEILEINEHVQGCAHCALRFAEMEQTLSLIDQHQAPEMSGQFWEDFDTNITVKIYNSEEGYRGIEGPGVIDKVEEYFLGIFQLKWLLAGSLVVIALTVVTTMLVRESMRVAKISDQKNIQIVSKPVEPQSIVAQVDAQVASIKKESVQPESVQVVKVDEDFELENERESGRLILEDEILLQELLLLAELGEETGLPLDEELMYQEIKLIDQMTEG